MICSRGLVERLGDTEGAVLNSWKASARPNLDMCIRRTLEVRLLPLLIS
jgi:hypothetical protein